MQSHVEAMAKWMQWQHKSNDVAFKEVIAHLLWGCLATCWTQVEEKYYIPISIVIIMIIIIIVAFWMPSLVTDVNFAISWIFAYISNAVQLQWSRVWVCESNEPISN